MNHEKIRKQHKEYQKIHSIGRTHGTFDLKKRCRHCILLRYNWERGTQHPFAS